MHQPNAKSMDRNIVGELANDRPRPRLAEYLLSGEKLDIDLCRRRDVEGPVGDNQLVDATIRQPVMGNLPRIRKIRLPCIKNGRSSCREIACKDVYISVVAVQLQKKKKKN